MFVKFLNLEQPLQQQMGEIQIQRGISAAVSVSADF